MFKKILLAFVLVASLGCQSGNSAPGESRLRALLLSANGGNLDVLFNDEAVLLNAPYTTSTGYLRLAAGAASLKIRQTGTTASVLQTSALLAAGQRYTYAVVGLNGDQEGVVLLDDGAAPAAGQSSIRIFHAAEPIGNLDFYVTAPGASLAASTPVATNVSYKSATSYTLRAAGVYQVRATDTGTLNEVFTTGFVTLSSGEKQSAFLVENGGGGPPFGMIFLAD